MGLRAAMEFSEAARVHGHVLRVLSLNWPLCINGVGAGRAARHKACKFPIACARASRRREAPPSSPPSWPTSMTGSGEDPPAIPGLASMQKKRALLLLEEGKGTVIIPGEFAFKAQVGRGAEIVLWEKTPSGQGTWRSRAWSSPARPW